jgi:hypothetical protein
MVGSLSVDQEAEDEDQVTRRLQMHWNNSDLDWDYIEDKMRETLIENATSLCMEVNMGKKEFIRHVLNLNYSELQDLYIEVT